MFRREWNLTKLIFAESYSQLHSLSWEFSPVIMKAPKLLGLILSYFILEKKKTYIIRLCIPTWVDRIDFKIIILYSSTSKWENLEL